MRTLKGKVTMELSEYNYLLQEAIKYRDLIIVDTPYEGTVQVRVDIASIQDEIVKMAKEKFPEMEVDTNAFDRRWNMPSANIGTLPVEDEEEEI